MEDLEDILENNNQDIGEYSDPDHLNNVDLDHSCEGDVDHHSDAHFPSLDVDCSFQRNSYLESVILNQILSRQVIAPIKIVSSDSNGQISPHLE